MVRTLGQDDCICGSEGGVCMGRLRWGGWSGVGRVGVSVEELVGCCAEYFIDMAGSRIVQVLE